MIQFCCYYCANFERECQLGHLTCYNALGGPDYVLTCRVEEDKCAEAFDNGKTPVIEAHKNCWKGGGIG